MINSRILTISFCALPGVVVFVELILFLPVKKRAQQILRISRKAISVMRSPNISDHWKEKALPRYSRELIVSSLLSTFYLVILFLGFVGTYGIFGLLFIGDPNEILGTLSLLEMQLVTVIWGMLYAFLRNGVTKSKDKTNINYTFSSKLLHRVVLNHAIIKEMAFDIDCMITKIQPAQPKVASPVYIAGLARAGTTILLEALYSTGAFTTLTYRDMPFVTAPYLWSKIAKLSKITDESKKERAHGDNIYVNYDSPEAFEEVFWLTFSKPSYVKADHLEVQDVDEEIVQKYRNYIRNIVARDGKRESPRYLSKNNNNLLRIGAIKSAHADSIIIAPFRNPINHAKSLLNQHEQFIKTHSEDSFSLQYMNWLGHFEFGANLKPLKVQQDLTPVNIDEPFTLDYWLRYWKGVYEYLLDYHSASVIFFDYDKFCEKPEQSLASLESELSLSVGSLRKFSSNIYPSKRYTTASEPSILPSQIKDVHQRLQNICI